MGCQDTCGVAGDAIVARWKTWAKEAGLPRPSVNSGDRNIRKSGRPTATMKALQREFAAREPVPDKAEEPIDYSDRTEELARTYRKNAPAMQEVDLASELMELRPVYVRVAPIRSLEPMAGQPDYPPIPDFLRR